jgi:peptidoglycan/xylan/chitin deacetylase (PgdA/CDA1 family)
LKGLDLPVGTFALTFDDGPSAVTEGLATWLRDQGIAATFFVNGYHRTDSDYQRRLGALVKAGHLLANHTENHCYSGAKAAPCNSTRYASLGADTQFAEVMRVHSDIAALQPQGPFLLRTPGGSWDATTAATLNSRLKVDYLGPIHWSAGDNVQIGGVNYKADYACWSSNTSVATCLAGYQAMIRNAKRGFILMHDLKGQTVEMVKLLVPWMKTAGYKFALPTASPTVQALAGAKGMPNDAKPTCQDCEDPAPRATVGQTCGASGGTACIWSAFGKGATCAKDGASVPLRLPRDRDVDPVHPSTPSDRERLRRFRPRLPLVEDRLRRDLHRLRRQIADELRLRRPRRRLDPLRLTPGNVFFRPGALSTQQTGAVDDRGACTPSFLLVLTSPSRLLSFCRSRRRWWAAAPRSTTPPPAPAMSSLAASPTPGTCSLRSSPSSTTPAPAPGAPTARRPGSPSIRSSPPPTASSLRTAPSATGWPAATGSASRRTTSSPGSRTPRGATPTNRR